MGISFGQLALYSKNKGNLSSFLSELLEAELRPAGEAVRLIHDRFTILIFDEPRSTPASVNMLVDFFVSSYEELEELSKKAQFFAYRYGISHDENLDENSISSIKNLGPISYFFVSDTDGRKWKFSHRPA